MRGRCSTGARADRNDFRPVPLTGEDREQVLARLRRYGEELGAAPPPRP